MGTKGKIKEGRRGETCDGRMVSESVMARVVCRRLPG